MNAVGIIPARWASSRFEGKVITEIGDKSLIQLVWEGARQSKKLDDLIIAVDDKRVEDVVKKFSGKAQFTSPKHSSGTDRISEVARSLNAKIIVNIQGDEPLVKGEMIDGLVDALIKDKKAVMATIIKRIEDIREVLDPNVVKVVIDKEGYALYFSRSPIPHIRSELHHKAAFDFRNWLVQEKFKLQNLNNIYYKHIGLYAYRKDFLLEFSGLTISNLEKAEKLEQLRALENGFKIKTVQTWFETVGVDTPSDLEKVKKILRV